MPRKTLTQHFDDYAKNHQSSENQITHALGIPLIIIGLFGFLSHFNYQPVFLSSIPFLRADASLGLITLITIGYAILDWKIAIPFSFILTGLYFIGRAVSIQTDLILFILGWILQSIGHFVYEKKSPSFFKNLIHLWIGPIWLFSKIIKYGHPITDASQHSKH